MQTYFNYILDENVGNSTSNALLIAEANGVALDLIFLHVDLQLLPKQKLLFRNEKICPFLN